MTEPLVSCLMVTRDRPELARRALHCFAQQTWANKELVIVDDGATDYVSLVYDLTVQGLQVRYEQIESRPDVRLGGLRNLTLELARGAWCIQWDDDEWYHPQRIEHQMKASEGVAGVALRWTLMHVESARLGILDYRADTGVATPGTILHHRDAARYPNLARGEDAAFLREVRRVGGLRVLGREYSHLFVRCFHGANTWEEQHFLARLHRRPVDWWSYASAAVRHDVRRHRAFSLAPREHDAIDRLVRCTADLAEGGRQP